MGKHKMVCHRRTGKYTARLALALGVLQLVAVLGSWIFRRHQVDGGKLR